MYKTFQRRLQEKWYFFPIILVILTLALATHANYVHAENTTLISNETTPVVPLDNTTDNPVNVECMKQTVQETNTSMPENNTNYPSDVDPGFSVPDNNTVDTNTSEQEPTPTIPETTNTTGTTGLNMIHINQIEPTQGWYIPQHTQHESLIDTLNNNLSKAVNICIKSIFVGLNCLLYACIIVL